MTQIKTWEIMGGKLERVGSQLADYGRTELEHLERWILSEPKIIGEDISLIGRQVPTRSGPLDLLGIDHDGNTVIIELKRERLARDALAQAVDYAADIARWDMDRLSEVTLNHTGESLEDFLSDTLEEGVLEGLNVNRAQRILLVGFVMEPSLIRMIEWLTGNYGVRINAVVLHYVRTHDGAELLSRTTTVPEEVDTQPPGQRFKIPTSDEPGTYSLDDLEDLLKGYFNKDLKTPGRIRRVLVPKCLRVGVVTRDHLKRAFLEYGEPNADKNAGHFVSLISNQIGMEKNDFLRQVFAYDYPNYAWEKDNYRIREGYEELLERLITDDTQGGETVDLMLEDSR